MGCSSPDNVPVTNPCLGRGGGEQAPPLLDERAEPRDEVLHRTRMTLVDRRQFSATVVNVSPNGLMIRADAAVCAGEWIKVQLPIVGEVHAAVRWALGGRVGCQLDRSIPPQDYHAALAAMRS